MAEFTDIISECTNLSVGYYREHTVSESQDIEHLESLAQACLGVDWENLPTKRDPKYTEYKTSTYSTKTSGIDYAYGNNRGKRKSKKSGRNGYHDDWYDDDSRYDYGNYESKGYGDSMSEIHSNRGKKHKKTRRSGKNIGIMVVI